VFTHTIDVPSQGNIFFLALVSELFGHVVMLCTVYQNPCVLLLGHDLTDFVILPNKIPIDTTVFLNVSLLIACVLFLFSNDMTYHCNSIIVFVCVCRDIQ
jgi:hypothetical protein